MAKLDRMLISIKSLGDGEYSAISSTAMLAVTLAYLIAVLSVPLHAPQKLIWLAVYPVVQSEISGISYGRLFLKSLWILPIIVLIGIFNPIIDTTPAFTVGRVTVSRGWVSFISLTLRGLLAVQATFLLVLSTGFYDMCHALRHFGCPKILVTQLQFTYRYLVVIAEDACRMDRARKARGFGRKNYPLSMWGRFVGQLLVGSYDRANAIHRAMLSRCFNGTMPSSRSHKMNIRSWVFIGVWCGVIAALWLIDFSTILTNYIDTLH